MLAIGLAIFTLSSATRMFMPRRPVSPSTPSTAARSQVPMMPLFDFGTANFEAPEGKKTSFFIGVERDEDRQPNKFSKDGADTVNINPLALLLAGAPVVLVTTLIAALCIITPGWQTPFKFLDPFFPPRVAEVKLQAEKKAKYDEQKAKEAAAAKAKAEKKAKAEAEAKAAAEAEEAKKAKGAPVKK